VKIAEHLEFSTFNFQSSMETIGTQVRLPFKRALAIAVSGIRIRLGRSLVTVSGVVLGIAFLMSNLTGQIVKTALSEEREQSQRVDMMMSLVNAEVGSLEDRTVAVAAFGRVTATDLAFVGRVNSSGPALFRAHGLDRSGLTAVSLQELGKDADLVFVMGDAASASISLQELTAGMASPLVLDTQADREYTGEVGDGIRREPFFGKQAEDMKEEAEVAARTERFRVTWILVISLLVTVVTVANALLMSVTERFREIGTMKCLGALSKFIRRLFLIESALIGMAGSVCGALVGAALTMVIYGAMYGFGKVLLSIHYGQLLLAAVVAVVCGSILSMAAAVYPARVASRMVPADALRSTV
jgi:ABC-type antimicrobial peptide transport system permease subunit